MNTFAIELVMIASLAVCFWRLNSHNKRLKEVEARPVSRPKEPQIPSRVEHGTRYARMSCMCDVCVEREMLTPPDQMAHDMGDYYSTEWLVGSRAEALALAITKVFHENGPSFRPVRAGLGKHYEFLNDRFEEQAKLDIHDLEDDMLAKAGNYYPLGWLTELRVKVIQEDLKKVFLAHQEPGD